MKKTAAIVMMAVLFACALMAGALGEGNSYTQINQSLAPGEDWQRIVTDTSAFALGEMTPLEGEDGLYIGDWGTYPSIDGSTVCVPLAMELARQWLDLEEKDLNGFVNFSTTPYAYDRLTAGEGNPMVTILSKGVMMDPEHPVDIVMGTGPNADERLAAENAGKDLVMVPICYDAFVFLVNGENPVDSLTVDQIRAIYTGAIVFWNEVGGENLQIDAYQRPHGSGSQTAMEEMVMQGLEISQVKENYISDGMSDAVRQIGNYDNGQGAIGYSYLYYVNTLVESGGIRVLAVDGVAPTVENLQSGAYPFTVNYYAVYRKGDENTEAFVNWLVSPAGQQAVRQAGYVPLYE